MAHQRKLIRKAVIDRLKSANTMAGERVLGNRGLDLKRKHLPCILVYTGDEPAEISTEAPREYKRNLSIVLELIVRAEPSQDLDDVLDDFAEQVEAAIFADETFGGKASDTLLSNTEVETIEEGDAPIGAAKVALTVPYYTYLPAGPAEPLANFQTANMKIDLAPKDGVINSEDSVSLPQT